MPDPMQTPRNALLAPATRRRSTARYHVRWWVVTAALLLLVYGSLFVLVEVVT